LSYVHGTRNLNFNYEISHFIYIDQTSSTTNLSIIFFLIIGVYQILKEHTYVFILFYFIFFLHVSSAKEEKKSYISSISKYKIHDD
jgi:hypothetical protein